jgi:hypothetical protein
MARIFVRQRRHAGPGTGRPRFAVVAVEGDLTFLRPWLRRAELENIAQVTGAELVYLTDRSEKRERQSGQE